MWDCFKLMRTLVLYVEDEEDDACSWAWRSNRRGWRSRCGRWGTDGRRSIIWRARRVCGPGQDPLPAVVLLDLNLPLVSGFEVLKWMRERPEFTGLPVVVFSSSSREEDKAKARELGADEFVEKPHSARGFGGVVEGLKERWLGRVSFEG